jgi:transcriptional regulator with XRE-family HTH domain
MPGLSEQLLAARKSSDMSLLEICRQLGITPTYWYKLEKADTNTISYELLTRIADLLSLKLDINFSKTSEDHDFTGENSMDLSRLKWVKNVKPADNWPHYWALSPAEIAEYKQPILQANGLTIVPLGFKHEGSERLATGDQMLLTQRAKITHIVEILDDQPYEDGGWFNRYVKIVWWQPNRDWHEYPHRKDILGFDTKVRQGIPYELPSSFEKAFNDRWGEAGGLQAFQNHLANQLALLDEMVQQQGK